MRPVNLLPADAYAPRQRLPYAPIVLAATAPVFAAALVYLGYSVEHSKVTDRQLSLAVFTSQIAALGPSPQLAIQSGQVASERSLRTTALDDALAKQLPLDVTFDQISRVLPANAWLTTLTAAAPTAPAPAPTTTTTTSSSTTTTTPAAPAPAAVSGGPVTIQGYTYSTDDVAHVLARLALVPSLSGVTLNSAATTQLGKKNVVQFTIAATISGVPS
jgi:Tfp pilus assembly protein PilN